MKTVAPELRMMMEHYCSTYHCQGTLCKKCEALIAFEQERMQTCSGCGGEEGCSRQCYPASIRLQINHVIRWAEPRMRWRKPFRMFWQMLSFNEVATKQSA